MIPESLASPGKWHREGRGLTSEIESLTADTMERAICALPEEWAPYRLLAATKLKQGKHYVDAIERHSGWPAG